MSNKGRRSVLIVSLLVAVLTVGTAMAASGVHDQQVDITTVDLITGDLVYSAHDGLLYASVPSRSSAIPDSLAWIDPGTGVVEGWIEIGPDPGPMAVSSDGTAVYVGLNGSGEVRAFDVEARVAGPGFSVGEDPGPEPGEPGTPFVAVDIEALPGARNAVAVVSRVQNSTGPYLLGIYEDGIKRNDDVANPPRLALEFGSTSSDLFGLSGSLFHQYVVDDEGVRLVSETEHVWPAFRTPSDIEFDGGRMYGTLGQIFDPYTVIEHGSFFDRAGPLYRGINIIEPDSNEGVTYVVEDPEIPGLPVELEVYDNESFQMRSETPIPGSLGQPASLVKAGQRLAYRTTTGQFGGQIIIIELPAPVIDTRIDIEPQDDSNVVIFEGNGLVTVVAFGSEDLDVSSVVFESIRFGVLGHEVAAKHGGPGVMASHIRDVDDDQRLDLIAHFRLEGTGIEPGIPEACVTGLTVDDYSFAGCDTIDVWSRPSPPPMSPPISGGVDVGQTTGTSTTGTSTTGAYAAVVAGLFGAAALTARRSLLYQPVASSSVASGDGSD